MKETKGQSADVAIRIKDVSKMYKLYDRNRDRLFESLGLARQKRYREHYALRGLSFEVGRGETVGIIGTNGAGKSTILKIITGVLNQTAGEVEIEGRISALLELGAGFNQEYSGIDNIYLNGTMLGYTKAEIDAKMESILKFADIGDYVYQPVKTYSSGMFVRLAFAVAINIDPEILVVDEALSVGDVFFQAKCYKKFDEFKKAGKTILFVSHDLSSIAKYCDRVILLNKGEKVAEGKPKEIINLYKKILSGTDEDREKIERIAHGEGGDEALKEMLENGAPTDVNGKSMSIFEGADDPRSWKHHFEINPNVEEYGNRDAEIIDFAVIDEAGHLSNTIEKGTRFAMRTKVHFHRTIEQPIFTYTFKTVRGVDVTGTNTMFEDKELPEAKAGETYVVEYQQAMDLQGGEYLLSMSCTGYVDGELKAFHRCYDLLSVSVISSKDTVGFYDMNSEITIRKV